MRQLSRECRPPKYFTDVCPSNIWGVYTRDIFDGHTSHASVIRGVYTPKIFDRCMSVKYLGSLHPRNI